LHQNINLLASGEGARGDEGRCSAGNIVSCLSGADANNSSILPGAWAVVNEGWCWHGAFSVLSEA